MSLFSTEYQEEPIEKKPTLLQYIKAHKGKNRPKAFHIELIWLPNRFASYAIETDKFRLTCATTSLMGKAIEAETETILESRHSIHLGISETKEGLRVYSFLPGSTPGVWTIIESDKPLGLKFQAS